MGQVSSARDGAHYVEKFVQMAEGGEPEAFYNLGLAFATGQGGINVDLVSAHKWFNLAAVHGIEQALAERAALAREMTNAEIAEAQRQAREWTRAH
jgi:uncharacterized protein